MSATKNINAEKIQGNLNIDTIVSGTVSATIISATAFYGDGSNLGGVVKSTDSDTSSFSFVLDEDNMVSDSDTKVPTQQSVKAYVDIKVASSVTYQGGYDASTTAPNASATKGDMYTVTVAGNGGGYFTTSLEIGDVIISEIDNPSSETDWTVVNKDLDAASIKTSYESNANTNAFTDVEQTKLGHISVTQAVDLDTMESDIATNNAKVSNVTTNLSISNRGSQTLDVVSSDGTDATIPEATPLFAGLLTASEKNKLTGIEAGADVTDSTNVEAAGAVMETDTSTVNMQFVVDEDNMVSDSDTKVPTQQSVKAYVDGLDANNIKKNSATHNKTFTLESPTSSDDITIFRTDVDITVQEVIAVSTGTSPSTTYQLKHSTDRNAAGNALTTSSTTTSTTTGNVATLSDATIPANSWVWFESTSASGTDVRLTIDIRYTID